MASLVVTTPRRMILEKALAKTLEEIPDVEKAAFTQASMTIDETRLLSSVQDYDAKHKNQSAFRPHAERLSKFLNLLNRFMGGVAIGIQASPEISALVVGSVRIVIDLALQYTTFFSKLTDMICTFENYLGPLAEYAKATDIEVIEISVIQAYACVLKFGWKARRVFIDAKGNQLKWKSLRAFMHQQWEPFEIEFATIEEDLKHQFDMLLHATQALHFDHTRKADEARRREEESMTICSNILWSRFIDTYLGKERSAFLAWVSSIDFEQTHVTTFAKKHGNTCDWLIREPKYQQWLSGSTSALLWCSGKRM